MPEPTYTYNVEWDDEKNLSNILKHGIPFNIAAKVFLDDNVLIIYDDAHSINEERYIALGLVEEVIVVIFTMRNEVYRLISARVATKREKEAYYGNF